MTQASGPDHDGRVKAMRSPLDTSIDLLLTKLTLQDLT